MNFFYQYCYILVEFTELCTQGYTQTLGGDVGLVVYCIRLPVF